MVTRKIVDPYIEGLEERLYDPYFEGLEERWYDPYFEGPEERCMVSKSEQAKPEAESTGGLEPRGLSLRTFRSFDSEQGRKKRKDGNRQNIYN